MYEQPNGARDPRKFARIFEDEEIGQLLVFLDRNDEECPCVRAMFYSPRYEAYVTVTGSYPDSDEGIAAAETRFASMSLATAKELALVALEQK